MHHSNDSHTGDGVSEENRDRTSIGEGTTDTKEETCTDCSTEGDKLDVARLQAGIQSVGET